MTLRSKFVLCLSISALLVLAGCKANGTETAASAAQPPFMSAVASAPPQKGEEAPSPDKTGGFDGQRAFAHVAKQVSFGPHPSGSPAIAQVQDYLLSELKSYGCTTEADSFSSDTPAGRIAMKNMLVKIPGEKPGVLLLGTHYDTKRLDNFVGADDGGSSTGLMLEIARLLCKTPSRYSIWIAFLDGEEAVQNWSETDSRYGSRQMAAKLAINGDLKKVRAFLLADIVGGRNVRFYRESSSTPAFTDLFWNTAAKLGYSSYFLSQSTSAEDDHDSFLKRGVPSLDVIGDFTNNGYWHTPQDTLDKISPKSLAITGHVFLESVKQLQAK